MAAKLKNSRPRDHFLGVEGGATHSVCLLADETGHIVRRVEVGPANILLLSDSQFTTLLRQIKRAFADCPKPDAICLGLAGAHGEAEFARIYKCAQKIWPGLPLKPTHDLETALSSSESIKPSKRPLPPRVLVLSGTGSCFLGKSPDGTWSRFGGWGHVIGDKGSGYEIGLHALKACAFCYDRDGRWSRLGERILRALNMNHPRDLIPWSPHASKKEIAMLAKEVFEARRERDPIAKDVLIDAASSLGKDAVSCARKLVPQNTPVEFVLAGSVLRKQPGFAKQVIREIKSHWPTASAAALKGESAWGAVILAAREWQASGATPNRSPNSELLIPIPKSKLSPTEQRNPKSANLDKLSVGDAIDLMLSEDKRLPAAIAKEKAGIEKVIRAVTKAFKTGGRLFYVGAGTSGRLGILDASECPPTFRADPEMVQGIIAGGMNAVFTAVEGAEDNRSAGAEAIRFRGITKQDVVVGIAASGRTPFVHGALDQAKAAGAYTALVCFNPEMKKVRSAAKTTIAPNIGSEILTGSTRLKSGTATKLILNMFTTLAMVRIGKVMGNRMVDLNASNTKLRDRAARIVEELTGVEYEVARAALEQNGWVVRKAVESIRV